MCLLCLMGRMWGAEEPEGEDILEDGEDRLTPFDMAHVYASPLWWV